MRRHRERRLWAELKNLAGKFVLPMTHVFNLESNLASFPFEPSPDFKLLEFLEPWPDVPGPTWEEADRLRRYAEHDARLTVALRNDQRAVASLCEALKSVPIQSTACDLTLRAGEQVGEALRERFFQEYPEVRTYVEQTKKVRRQ